MKWLVSWGPAVLAVLFHLGGAVSLHKKQPDVVTQLRQALAARTEEVRSQKNIAHGLELEVRELQSDLQSAKKGLAVETQKERVLSQKLHKVRAALGPDDASASQVVKPEQGSPKAAMPAVVAAVAAEPPLDVEVPVVKASAKFNPLQSLEEDLQPLPAVVDSELEPSEAPEVIPQQAPKLLKAPVEEPVAVVHARQTTPQEPPPFFEAAALQSNTALKRLQAVSSVLHAEKAVVAGEVKARVPVPPQRRARAPVQQRARAPVPDHVVKAHAAVHAAKSAVQHAAAKRPVAMRGSSKPVAAKATVVVQAAPAAPVAQGAGGSDFDALEAQLHEEDRRIQDLDRENALDVMTDGGVPAAPGSAPQAAPAKAVSAQPKLELDAEAPMEDFLNVEAPGPEVGENAPAASAAQPAEGSNLNAPDGDSDGLALPQVGNSLEGALSDNQFLAQIAPRHN